MIMCERCDRMHPSVTRRDEWSYMDLCDECAEAWAHFYDGGSQEEMEFNYESAWINAYNELPTIGGLNFKSE